MIFSPWKPLPTFFIFSLGLHTSGRITEPKSRITSKTPEPYCQIVFLKCCKGGFTLHKPAILSVHLTTPQLHCDLSILKNYIILTGKGGILFILHSLYS